MSGIKFELQKEVFESSKERLHSVVSVNKFGRKKSPHSYLCITGSIERPIRFTIYLVKKTEKGFKKKQDWTLSTLKETNYRSKDSAEFDLQLEKWYQWSAGSVEEKDGFFIILYQICARLHRPPKFINYQPNESDETGNSITIASMPKGEIEENDEEEYGLTDGEEHDLEKVLGRVQNAVVNAEAYMQQLARELSILDGENIHSIMESEGQVKALMNSIDVSIVALDEIESELTAYEETVTHVQKSVEKIEVESLQMGVVARNNLLLLTELQSLITALDFPLASILLTVDLRTEEGIGIATEASFQLRDALSLEGKVHPALLKLTAVVEQKKNLERVQRKFAYNLADTFTNIYSETWGSYNKGQEALQQIRLPAMTRTHSALIVYEELSGWLKTAHADLFGNILQGYSTGIHKLYDESIKEIFREAVKKISTNSSSSNSKLSTSATEIQHKGKFFGKTRSLANKDFDTESQGSGEGSVDSSERQHFYDVLDQILDGLAAPLNSEEEFISRFFHIESSSGGTTPGSLTSPVTSARGMPGGELRKIMTSLFGSVEVELNNFLTMYERLEPSFCMGAMVKLGHHALRSENQSCYISVVFGTILIQEKRSFDRLMHSYVQAIADTRPTRKSKSEILAFVVEFEDFAIMAESIFENSPRRSELEKWYGKMLSAIFDGVIKHSNESGGKVPGEVIRMENYHRLHSILFKLKVGAMEQQKKEAKGKYIEALNAYVTKYLGRPLVKLNEFFEGVQQKVSQGVKESEIGYQMSFSRVELKRIIKEYTTKEVKKGLDSLYKKLEKHLSEEKNLLQVVWRAMQEEFIVQYKTLETLIARCYPGAKITLEFTIQDVLELFSEIARMH